jgi:8-oxo-dGTP pyrophosphatase MutT (NUDIX family)
MPFTSLRHGLERLRMVMRTRDPRTGLLLQTGALPWRFSDDAGLEVLLITGRRSSRWLLPKGWPMLGKTLAAAAAQEAFEEAGVIGRVDPAPLGAYLHTKQHVTLGDMKTRIIVHTLLVEQELTTWPESSQRQRRWFEVEQAARKVEAEGLADLILELRKHLLCKSP